MKLVRDFEEDAIALYDKDKILLKLEYIADEFCINVFTNDVVKFTREIDAYFYDNLCYIMNNNYEFFIPPFLSYKENNKLQWYSDAYGDFEDEKETDQVSRLIIEKKEDAFLIHAEKPMYKKFGINRTYHCIIFSPGGNGYQTRNLESNFTFQDDIVKLFQDTINYQKTEDTNKLSYKIKKFKKDSNHK